MRYIQYLWSQFLALNCPVWIPAAAGLGVLFLLVIPLAVKRGKWKRMYLQAEEDNNAIRSKGERDVTAAKDNARKEMEKLQKKSDEKLEEAKAAAKEEADRITAEADSEIETIIRNSELDLMAAKERMERILHEERETMKSTEQELRGMDEKELLVQTMLTLGGYGTRLDRLEASLAKMERRVRVPLGTDASQEDVPSAAEKESTPPMNYLRGIEND